MTMKRAYTAEPVSDETGRRLRMGRGKLRLFGMGAAALGALIVPIMIAGIGMGYFQLDQKMGPTVFPKLLSEDEAKAEEQRVEREAAAFREKKAAEKEAAGAKAP